MWAPRSAWAQRASDGASPARAPAVPAAPAQTRVGTNGPLALTSTGVAPLCG